MGNSILIAPTSAALAMRGMPPRSMTSVIPHGGQPGQIRATAGLLYGAPATVLPWNALKRAPNAISHLHCAPRRWMIDRRGPPRTSLSAARRLQTCARVRPARLVATPISAIADPTPAKMPLQTRPSPEISSASAPDIALGSSVGLSRRLPNMLGQKKLAFDRSPSAFQMQTCPTSRQEARGQNPRHEDPLSVKTQLIACALTVFGSGRLAAPTSADRALATTS
jgi:hypothetical protein